jgi:hypothetical protein
MTGAPRVLTDKQLLVAWSLPSHDGKRLAMFASTQTSDVWTLEGF